MWGETANNNAINTIEIKIQKGNLLVNIGNGSTTIMAVNSMYRWQHGRFELIGEADSYGRTDEGRYSTFDTNLNTSYEIDSHTKGASLDGSNSGKTKEEKFYFLRAGTASSAPSLTLPYSQWKGVAARLQRSDNVTLGKSIWHGADDFSAELKGVVAGKDLFIVCRLIGKDNGKVHLRLRDDHGRLIDPIQAQRSATNDGEQIAIRFPLSALKIDQENNIQASIQVLKTDAAGKPVLVLSTSCDGEKHTGMIRTRKTPDLPTLANFDWDHRDD